MVKTQRRCIFCESASGTKISKEHVFGLWLKEMFPRDSLTSHQAISIDWPDAIGPQTVNETRKNRQGHVGSKQLRVLCRKCNNEVFSGLEVKAKSALEPLIHGAPAKILPGGQTLLATWAAKTAMIAEHFKPVESGIPQSDRSWLLNNMTPPDQGWLIWIAPYNGVKWRELSIYQARVGLSPVAVSCPSEAPYYGQATTFGVGHILFCAVSSASPFIHRLQGYEPSGLIQIWPRQERSILWPTLSVLTDKHADEVANFFKFSGVFDQSSDPAGNWSFSL